MLVCYLDDSGNESGAGSVTLWNRTKVIDGSWIAALAAILDLTEQAVRSVVEFAISIKELYESEVATDHIA